MQEIFRRTQTINIIFYATQAILTCKIMARPISYAPRAEVAKLVDALDSKSSSSDTVPVRFRPSVPFYISVFLIRFKRLCGANFTPTWIPDERHWASN
jgi:hypothetical protein